MARLTPSNFRGIYPFQYWHDPDGKHPALQHLASQSSTQSLCDMLHLLQYITPSVLETISQQSLCFCFAEYRESQIA